MHPAPGQPAKPWPPPPAAMSCKLRTLTRNAAMAAADSGVMGRVGGLDSAGSLRGCTTALGSTCRQGEREGSQ